MIYLASPYKHEKEIVVQMRFFDACEATALLIQAGKSVFSPIVHNHSLVSFLGEKYRHDHDFWMKVDKVCFDLCSSMIILKLDRWEESKGIKIELEWAANKNFFKTVGYTLEELRELSKNGSLSQIAAY